MGKTGKLVLAVAAGFVAGVLLAPKSGKETRNALRRKTQEAKKYTDKATKQAEKAAREAIKLGDKVKDHADQLTGETKHTAARVQKDMKK